MAAEENGHVTLEQVARHAGVSLATASRALNGSDRKVRSELRDRVLASAAELRYTANANAQAMARGRTSVVGLVVHDIADPYFSAIAAGAIEPAAERHLLVTLASTGGSPEREIQHVTALRAQRAQAIVLAGSRWTPSPQTDLLEQELRAFEAGGGRVVLISQPGLDVDTIAMDNVAGAEALVHELCDQGYRRFAVLAGPPELLTARDRAEGFRRGAAARGLHVEGDAVVHGEFTRDGGYAAAQELLARNVDVECVLAVNDVMAVGAMAALRDAGRDVPGDLSVAGFDDISTLRDITPGLTTVRMPLRDMGAMAIELVLDAGDGPRQVHRVTGEVVLRDSTPPRT